MSATTAPAAVLNDCPASPGAGAQTSQAVQVTLPDGSMRSLFIAPSATSASTAATGPCRSLPLPVPADAVLALKPVPPAVANGSGDAILLQGVPRGEGFGIDSVSRPMPEPASPPPMPWQDNLLTRMVSRVFGAEERAQAELADGRLHLRCSPGTSPAGVTLSGPWSLSAARLVLALTASGSGSFEIQALDADGQLRESPAILGRLDAAPAAQQARFELPRAGFDRTAWRAFSIACPAGAAQLSVDILQVLPQPSAVPARASWVWQASAWQTRQEQVLAHARRYGVRTLFISVPVADGKVIDAERLAGFVATAGRQGVAVWSVDGDPRMVLPAEHGASVARVRAYARYNAHVKPEARLRGMQFDIEPYLMPGYELAAEAWDRQYVALARKLHDASAAALPLEFVVPFWWAGKPDLLHGLAPYTERLSVMDYRTDSDEILRFASPFLDWGVRHGKTVRIALEAGPVAAEQQRRYARDDAGQLWLLRAGQMDLLVLLKDAVPNPLGTAYREVGRRDFDGSATSFHADPQRLIDALPGLEVRLSAWKSFGGIALHELN